VGGSEKLLFLVLRWGWKLGDGESYCKCSKWPQLAVTQAIEHSRALTQHLYSHLVGCCNLSKYWVQCQIR